MDNVVRIAIIGLGYVGLPLAVEFSKKYQTIGLDINTKRITELSNGNDSTLEIEKTELLNVLKLGKTSNYGLRISSNSDVIKDCNIFIITVPTPIDNHHRPDLKPLYAASKMVGELIKKGDIVIYESTVYPGATEDECVPILERSSGLTYNEDFYCGYSPERINPGDKKHTLTKILKVTSGSTPASADKVDELYRSIIKAGTYKASSIRVAEAAKVIENSQRDVNIAFVNELSKIFSRLGIDTYEVLEAAGTKWNFLPFKPGLVGGHCIGVDPYYLAQKAQEVGYHPEILLAGRRINDSMGAYVASEMVKLMINNHININGAEVLMLGITFKENCPDIRNTKAIDVYNELISYNLQVDIFDPWADPGEVFQEYGIKLVSTITRKYNGILLTVAHKDFLVLDLHSNLTNDNGVIYDVKGVLDKESVVGRL